MISINGVYKDLGEFKLEGVNLIVKAGEYYPPGDHIKTYCAVYFPGGILHFPFHLLLIFLRTSALTRIKIPPTLLLRKQILINPIFSAEFFGSIRACSLS